MRGCCCSDKLQRHNHRWFQSAVSNHPRQNFVFLIGFFFGGFDDLVVDLETMKASRVLGGAIYLALRRSNIFVQIMHFTLDGVLKRSCTDSKSIIIGVQRMWVVVIIVGKVVEEDLMVYRQFYLGFLG